MELNAFILITEWFVIGYVLMSDPVIDEFSTKNAQPTLPEMQVSLYGTKNLPVMLDFRGMKFYRKRIVLPDAEVESKDQPVKPASSGKPSWLPLLIVLVIGVVIGLSLR